MQTAGRDMVYCYHSAQNLPQITVKSGEEFCVETELATGPWLMGLHELWTPEKTCGLNPTVVVAIENAMPGDALRVEILDIVPEPIGYTGFASPSNPLAGAILPRDWGLNTRTLRIDGGFVHWSDALKLPTSPMIGTLGTAPAVEVISNANGGIHGGNMDIQEVCTGATVVLPIEVPGALLHIGDVHALQGDGEINCAGGIECASTVRLRVHLVKRPEHYDAVRIENKTHIMVAACERSLEESFYLATRQMLLWLNGEYGLPLNEAYLLMGQVLEARATQFVNPTRSYIVKMPRWALPVCG